MMPYTRPAGRHLSLVHDNEPPPPSARAARDAVVALGVKFDLELFDGLLALVAAHDDPDAAIRELRDMRQNAVHVIGYVFDNVIENHTRRRRCAQ